MAGSVKSLLPKEEQEKEVLFYLERVLELVNFGCVKRAQKVFHAYQHDAERLLSSEHYNLLVEKISIEDDWDQEKEIAFWQRLHHAEEFSEYQAVHDIAHEILLHYSHPTESCPTHEIYEKVNRILSRTHAFYLEPDDVRINTFIDAEIDFVVEKRRPNGNGSIELKGNPGFYLTDAMGRKYRCFVKQVEEAKEGQVLPLKITNIPGLSLTSKEGTEPILYLEPRVEPGDMIEVEIASLSHTGNSFTFRHHSYDGFLWFKRRGVNKKIFNEKSLKPKDRVIAKVLYTSEEEKHKNGKIARLGVVKAIPMHRAEQAAEENPDNDAARVLN